MSVVMLAVLVWLGGLKEMSCQFAPHMDLQKIDEIMFDNSKYNVLKPTIHITRDHFKDFIQKQVKKDFPGKKIYLDENGIRHYWRGFEPRGPKSLRKAILETTGVTLNDINTVTDKTDVTIKIDKVVNLNVKFDSTKNTEIKKVKIKPKRKKKVIEPDGTVYIRSDKLALRNDDGKTKVKTTFFCPFFGIVTMMSYLD